MRHGAREEHGKARWSRIAAFVSILAVALGMTACSKSGDGDELLIYNAQHESLTKEWIDAFTKETGIKVTYRQGGDTELGNQLVAEGDASPADVFLTENSPAMAAVEKAGLFADMNPDTLAQVPAQYRPATGKWTGVAARSTVFVYNKAKLAADQLPKSMADLAQPAWKGRWGGAPAKADFQAIVAAYLALRGEAATAQWLAGMKANAKIYNDNIATMKAVNAGEVDGGIIYHYYWFRDQANTKEGSGNTALHYFKNSDPGAFVSLSGGGVLKSSKKADQAQQFIKFVTGKAGQQVLENGTSFEYPVASGVPANSALPPLDSLQAPKVDPSTLDAQKVVDLMTKAGLL
jgi:iron(III) transport system substrate-binding protein